MAQTLGDKQIFSLSEVARSIRRTLSKRYSGQYWVRAEMNKLNYYPQSGHCYPDLLEKRDGKIVAELSAIIWKQDYQRIARRFKVVAKESLKDGIEVLIQVRILFDEVHGISLRIIDLDPAYSLGVLQQERLAAIQQLKAAGIYESNRRLDFPLLPKRVAIISVETSKGLADFYQILYNNPWNYTFEFTLFPALLQGDKAVKSIQDQLVNIGGNLSDFDVVAIIRGGGADVGLSSYNNADLASAVARFPLPILTGIGHATNETVSELVAYKNAITPSGLAEFLTQHFHNFSVPVQEAEKVLMKKSMNLLSENKERLEQVLLQYNLGSRNIINRHDTQIRSLTQQLDYYARGYLEKQHLRLDKMGTKVQLLDPIHTLRRGFSIIRSDGKIISTISQVNSGQTISAQVSDGVFTGTINNIEDYGQEQ